MSTEKSRLGLYAWGGPGTVEMLRVKHGSWNMRVDEQSILQLYNEQSLRQAAALGVTDMWVTYSWGFGEQREQPHRQYLREKLPLFQRYGIRTHAYVQGPNRVVQEFNPELFCRDGNGQLLPYSAGRAMVCTRTPGGLEQVLQPIRDACNERVDGVFMDNMLCGAPPAYIRSDHATFFGCACTWCQEAFATEYGYPMPVRIRAGERQVRDTIDFRCATLQRLVAAASAICRKAGKEFGVNLFDPLWHDPALTFGYNLQALLPHVDYQLFENHALVAQGKVANGHLRHCIAAAGKPTFIVSYRKGIGCDDQWSQADINAIVSEAAVLGYFPCIKASEYVRGRVWHSADLSRWQQPVAQRQWQVRSALPRQKPLPRSSACGRILGVVTSMLQQRMGRWIFESRLPRIVPRRQLIAWMCRQPGTHRLQDATRA